MSQINNPNLAGHIVQDEGTPVPQQPNLNFIGTAVTVTDNPATGSTDVEITGSGGESVTRAFAYFIS